MIIRAVDVDIKRMFIKCKPPSGQMSMTLNVNALLLVPTTQSTPPVKRFLPQPLRLVQMLLCRH